MTINTDYKFSPYFPIILLSFVLSYLFIYIYSKSKNINKTHMFYSMLLHFVVSLYCGVMFTFVTNIINGESAFSKVGLSGMGGLIGTILSIIIMRFLFKEQKEHYTECYVMSLPLIYGISKLGCFLVGCCYGMPYTGPLCIRYIRNGIMAPDHSVFPVQLAECVLFVILSAVFYYLVCHKKIKKIVGIEIICCCILKFLLDYLRERPDWGLSVNQTACIIVSGLVLVCITFQSKRKTE